MTIISERLGLETVWRMTLFWSEIGSGFGEPGGTPPPRIPRCTPPPGNYLTSYMSVQAWDSMLRSPVKKECNVHNKTYKNSSEIHKTKLHVNIIISIFTVFYSIEYVTFKQGSCFNIFHAVKYCLLPYWIRWYILSCMGQLLSQTDSVDGGIQIVIETRENK